MEDMNPPPPDAGVEPTKLEWDIGPRLRVVAVPSLNRVIRGQNHERIAGPSRLLPKLLSAGVGTPALQPAHRPPSLM